MRETGQVKIILPLTVMSLSFHDVLHAVGSRKHIITNSAVCVKKNATKLEQIRAGGMTCPSAYQFSIGTTC
jgi:hypothetical protein